MAMCIDDMIPQTQRRGIPRSQQSCVLRIKALSQLISSFPARSTHFNGQGIVTRHSRQALILRLKSSSATR